MPTQDIQKINARDFGGFINENLGITVHKDDAANKVTKVFSGGSDKLEVG